MAMVLIGLAPRVEVVILGMALVDLRLPFIAAGVTAILLGLYLMAEMPERGFVRPDSPGVGAARDMTRNMRGTLKKGVHGIRSSLVLGLIRVIFVFLGAFEEGFDRL